MARMNCLSTFTSSEVRMFESNINSIKNDLNDFQLYEKIKQYYSKDSKDSKELKKYSFNPTISKRDVYDVESQMYLYEIVICGIIRNNLINDNDVFEEIYLFLEFLLIELDLRSLTFIFNGFDEKKMYNILNLKYFKPLEKR